MSMLRKHAPERVGIPRLIEDLPKMGYLTAPSSAKYHGSFRGGNMVHSILVAEHMLVLREALGAEVSKESCVIVGLFHDLGKCTYLGRPNYVHNTSTNPEGTAPYVHNKDRLPIPHQVASLHILGQYIELTQEEAFAILYHNGLYTPDGVGMKGHENELLMLVHMADMWVSRFVEAQKE